MATVRISLTVQAPPERCFDLARSVDFHLASTPGTGERAVAGRQVGLLEPNEEVTWEARHFWVRQRLRTGSPASAVPAISGIRRCRECSCTSITTTTFEAVPATPDVTRLTEVFEDQAAFGPLGRLAEWLFLTAYLRRFLACRLLPLKQALESERWRGFLETSGEQR